MSRKGQLSGCVDFNSLKPEITSRVREVARRLIGSTVYSSSDAFKWSTSICEQAIKALTETNNNFKYMATCAIFELSEGEVTMETCCFWNSQLDGNCVVEYENEFMKCVVNIFGVAI